MSCRIRRIFAMLAPAVRSAECIARDLVGILQRFSYQLLLVEAHVLGRHFQLRGRLRPQTGQNSARAREYQGRDVPQRRLRGLTGQDRCVAHLQLKFPVVRLVFPADYMVARAKLLGRIAF
jgi:hypothetical protein